MLLNKYRRMVAFVIDIFLVSMLAMFISSNLNYNPYAYDIEDRYKEFEEMSPTSSDFENLDESEAYLKELAKKAYDLEEAQIYVYGWYIMFYFLYFVIFAYFTEGQTLGKKFTKLRIVKNDGSRVGISNLFMRMLTNGSTLFMGTNLLIIFKILGVLLFKANLTYISFYLITSFLAFIIEMVNLFMFSLRKDNICLNDKISKSKIITIK